ncbi:MAG: restriction endonuclease subunit S [Fibrobacter sp.]|nr:restriction endonuclease subunit S [Fibrobacter sp.]
MNGAQLKNSILQWAIQGKLVPQNPKNEPAQKLLERIAASRNESSLSLPKGTSSTSLRGAKATKQSKKSAPISRIYRENGVWYEQVGNAEPKDISDDIPFEIPENWAWCRLGSLIKISSGDGLVAKDMKKGEIPVFGGNGITGYHTEANVFEETVVIGRVGFYCGSVHVTPPKAWITDNAFITEYPQNYIDRGFLVHCLKFLDLGKSHNATAQPVVSGKKIYPLLFPLPPLAEQKRIVAKLEKVLPLADEYGAAQEELDKLNKELPEALKKSILQQAIQGKLVPQNPKDEPAQKLLERIASSRHSERSEESSKRSKKTSKNPTSRIYRENGTWFEQIGAADPKDISEDIPFEIPENWAWCRVGNVISLLSGRDLEPSQYNASQIGIPYMTGASNFSNESLIVNRWTNSPITVSHKGDLLITCKGTIGTMAFNNVGDVHIARQIMAINSSFMNLNYVKYYLTSYVNELQKVARSMIPGISRDDLLSSLIPLPPLAEQKRIVTKLEQLFKVL